MARYIRLYPSPSPEKPGNILGFSGGIDHGARDPELHQWLAGRGYTVTPESDEQAAAKIYLGGLAVRTEEYHQAPGTPLPEPTVSTGHVFFEPPLRDDDLLPLRDFLRQLPSIDDGGFRTYCFVDNRTETPEEYGFSPDSLIGGW